MAFIPDGGVVKLSQAGRLFWGEVSRAPEIKETKNGSTFVKFSVCAGGDDKGEKRFLECVAFSRSLASYCADLERGDVVAGIGNVESHEYNGKTYYQVKLGWVNSPSVVAGASVPAVLMETAQDSADGLGTADPPKFAEQEYSEDDLPF